MPAIIFSGDFVKALKAALRLEEQATIWSGGNDPTSTPTFGRVGDVYIKFGASPQIYQKLGSDGTDTNWRVVSEQVLPIARGGTNSSTALVNNRIMQSSGGAIVEAAAITAGRALISDANGIPTHSSVTDVELSHLTGATGNLQTQINAKIPTSEKGAPNGVATLDAGGKLPVAQLPTSVMEYKGVWDASTNTPTLADGTGDAGDVWRVGTAGTQNLGSGPITFAVGDWVVYNGSVWEKTINSNAVISVNSQVGIVVLNTDDISEGATNKYFTDERAQDAIGAALTDSATIDFTYNDSANQITADVIDNSITDAKLRQSTGLSVIGRSANSTGNVADIVAANNHEILRRNGSSVGFGSIDLSTSGAVGTSVLQPSNGGTGSSAALSGNRVMISSSGAIVEASAITANRALVSDSNGIPVHSSITDTELGHLSGVTGNIQTQLNNKANDADVIKKDGSVVYTAAQSMGGFKITSLGTPTAASDASTKGYVDSSIDAVKPKRAVRVATTAAGVLATDFEAGDVVDGITLAAGDRILIKNQTAALENGVYIVQTSGSPVRAEDFNHVAEINGAMVPVQEGTVNAGRIFIQSGVVNTIGTDPINFVFFDATTTLVGGNGISITGSTIDVDHDGQGLQFTAGQLSLELDGSTLSKSAAGLKVATGGITNNEVNATAAIAYSKLNLSGSIVNADIAPSAAVDLNKLAALTSNRALVSDSSGVISTSSVTATELGYLSGVTGNIQTQLNNKADDSDVIKKNGSVVFTSHQSMGGFRLTNVGAPTASSDAATKAYVDSVIEGLKPKAAVRVATTTSGTLSTDFEAGDVVDGVTLVAGNRILIKDQTSAAENGIYIVQASGAPVRATDFDSITPIDEVNGAIVAVQEGTQNAGKIFVQTGTVNTIGTDPINFVFFNSVSALVGGDGITISGSNVEVDHDGQGLQFVSGQLSLELDGSTLSKSAAGLKISVGGITNTEVSNTAAIALTKLAALTADRALISNAAGVISVSSVTATELGYLSGATGNIQTQLDSKEPAFTVLPLSKGGTNKNISPVSGGIVWTDSDSMEVSAAGIAGQVLVSGGSGAPTWANRTPEIFGSRSSPRNIVAATGITAAAGHMSTTAPMQDVYVQGSVTGNSIAATITAGTIDGQRMTLIGRSNTNVVVLDQTTTNCALNGPVFLAEGDSITLRWDGVNWHEVNRS